MNGDEDVVSEDELRKHNVKFIEAVFMDLNGVLRGRTFPVSCYEKLVSDGFGFDGYSVGFLNIEDSDCVAKLDPATCKIYSVNGTNVAFFICSIEKDGRPLEVYPRYVFSEYLKKLGYKVMVGPEVEFYILKDGKPQDEAFYMASPCSDGGEGFKRDIMERLMRLGIEVELSHHEVGPGQHEIIIRGMEALEMADTIVFYKHFLRSYFRARGLDVTFMAKPFEELAGNGMHVHVSLWKDGENVFYDNGELSTKALHFIGGLLKYSKKLCLFTNSTVNSYKRLVPGFEAPTIISWGFGNRSTLIRIPKYRKMTQESARVEYRAPDPMGNVYLTMMGIVIAGIKGINEGVEPPEPFSKNAYEEPEAENLPSSLGEAMSEYEKRPFEEFGAINGKFLNTKRKEWLEYLKYLSSNGLSEKTLKVTEWEWKKYLHY